MQCKKIRPTERIYPARLSQWQLSSLQSLFVQSLCNLHNMIAISIAFSKSKFEFLGQNRKKYQSFLPLISVDSKIYFWKLCFAFLARFFPVIKIEIQLLVTCSTHQSLHATYEFTPKSTTATWLYDLNFMDVQKVSERLWSLLICDLCSSSWLSWKLR